MILRQLIQAGRRFCECRPSQFIPQDESGITVVAYTIRDQFNARRFEKTDPAALDSMLVAWLSAQEAIAYLHVQRQNHRHQHELPSPIGREPMDRLTHIAATRDEFQILTYFLEAKPQLDACRLHLAGQSHATNPATSRNLLARDRNLLSFRSPQNLKFGFAS